MNSNRHDLTTPGKNGTESHSHRALPATAAPHRQQKIRSRAGEGPACHTLRSRCCWPGAWWECLGVGIVVRPVCRAAVRCSRGRGGSGGPALPLGWGLGGCGAARLCLCYCSGSGTSGTHHQQGEPSELAIIPTHCVCRCSSHHHHRRSPSLSPHLAAVEISSSPGARATEASLGVSSVARADAGPDVDFSSALPGADVSSPGVAVPAPAPP